MTRAIVVNLTDDGALALALLTELRGDDPERVAARLLDRGMASRDGNALGVASRSRQCDPPCLLAIPRRAGYLVSAKSIYVTRPRQPRTHSCFWPECPQRVAASQLGCAPHWRRLPKHLRDAIWRSFRPGQEIDGVVSAGYRRAVRSVLAYVRELDAPRASA